MGGDLRFLIGAWHFFFKDAFLEWRINSLLSCVIQKLCKWHHSSGCDPFKQSQVPPVLAGQECSSPTMGHCASLCCHTPLSPDTWPTMCQRVRQLLGVSWWFACSPGTLSTSWRGLWKWISVRMEELSILCGWSLIPSPKLPQGPCAIWTSSFAISSLGYPSLWMSRPKTRILSLWMSRPKTRIFCDPMPWKPEFSRCGSKVFGWHFLDLPMSWKRIFGFVFFSPDEEPLAPGSLLHTFFRRWNNFTNGTRGSSWRNPVEKHSRKLEENTVSTFEMGKGWDVAKDTLGITVILNGFFFSGCNGRLLMFCLKEGSDQLNDQSRDDHSASWNQRNRHQKHGQNPCPWARPVDFASGSESNSMDPLTHGTVCSWESWSRSTGILKPW